MHDDDEGGIAMRDVRAGDRGQSDGVATYQRRPEKRGDEGLNIILAIDTEYRHGKRDEENEGVGGKLSITTSGKPSWRTKIPSRRFGEVRARRTSAGQQLISFPRISARPMKMPPAFTPSIRGCSPLLSSLSACAALHYIAACLPVTAWMDIS